MIATVAERALNFMNGANAIANHGNKVSPASQVNHQGKFRRDRVPDDQPRVVPEGGAVNREAHGMLLGIQRQLDLIHIGNLANTCRIIVAALMVKLVPDTQSNDDMVYEFYSSKKALQLKKDLNLEDYDIIKLFSEIPTATFDSVHQVYASTAALQILALQRDHEAVPLSGVSLEFVVIIKDILLYLTGFKDLQTLAADHKTKELIDGTFFDQREDQQKKAEDDKADGEGAIFSVMNKGRTANKSHDMRYEEKYAPIYL